LVLLNAWVNQGIKDLKAFLGLWKKPFTQKGSGLIKETLIIGREEFKKKNVCQRRIKKISPN